MRGHAFALQHKPGADFNVLILGLLCMRSVYENGALKTIPQFDWLRKLTLGFEFELF